MTTREVKTRLASKLKIRSGAKGLAVLIHAYQSSPDRLAGVRRVIESKAHDENEVFDFYVPRLSASTFSMAQPVDIVADLLADLGAIWQARRDPDGNAYDKVLLVGHSLGGLLARKLYVCSCGENPLRAPFERVLIEACEKRNVDLGEPQPWAAPVTRIVLLAGMNRGWTLDHHMRAPRVVLLWLGTAIGNLLSLLYGRPPLIFHIRRGSPFITQLRLQSLAMEEAAGSKGVGDAATVQLLGTIDDLVSPDDNIDLDTGRNFAYLDAPHSRHEDIIQMDLASGAEDERVAAARQKVFRQALSERPNELRRNEIPLGDEPLRPQRPDVTDVVFVIHGIRDEGYWTQKIARRVKAKALEANAAETAPEKKKRIFVSETSSYGYFAMLPFLLPWKRRDKVEWLMDQFTENRALYPNADFSFVGHSNGTYLLAKALEEYPSCHFKHVVFAGSVVRKDFPWKKFLREDKWGFRPVRAVVNYVASRDWVVAIFPKGLESLGFQDLGSAGYDGFCRSVDLMKAAKGQPASAELPYQLKFVDGSHSAALREDLWDSIAEFVVHGRLELPGIDAEGRFEHRRVLCRERTRYTDKAIEAAGRAAPLVWLSLLAGLVYGGRKILKCKRPEWQRTTGFLAYLWIVWKIVTRI